MAYALQQNHRRLRRRQAKSIARNEHILIPLAEIFIIGHTDRPAATDRYDRLTAATSTRFNSMEDYYAMRRLMQNAFRANLSNDFAQRNTPNLSRYISYERAILTHNAKPQQQFTSQSMRIRYCGVSYLGLPL